MDKKTVFYVDGLCEPKNPGGWACYGWVGYYDGKRVREGCGVIGHGEGMTNNVAEYNALIAAMQFLVDKKYTGDVEFKSDSQLVVNQMGGGWAINKDYLRVLNQKAQELSLNFHSVSYTWIPREQNEEADTMSRKAYSQRVAK